MEENQLKLPIEITDSKYFDFYNFNIHDYHIPLQLLVKFKFDYEALTKVFKSFRYVHGFPYKKKVVKLNS